VTDFMLYSCVNVCNCIAVYFSLFIVFYFFILLFLCNDCSMGSVPEIYIDWIINFDVI